MPVIIVLCIVAAFAYNNRLFDVTLMFLFGITGFIMRRRNYPAAPMILAIVLGGMMDSNFRRAVSLASSEERFFVALFGRPITIILTFLIIFVVVSNVPQLRRLMKNDH